MDIPNQIKIGAHKYLVYNHIFIEDDAMGQIFRNTKKIALRNHNLAGTILPLSHKWVVFIHEVLHAIDFLHGESIFIRNEESIESCAETIYQILLDNGLLPNYKLKK